MGLTLFHLQHEYVVTKWDKAAITEKKIASSIIELQCSVESVLQHLEITDPACNTLYRQVFHKKKPSHWKQIPTLPKIGIIILGIIGFLALVYFITLPFIADVIAKQIPIDYEIELGDKLYQSVLSEQKIDKEKTVAINSFFKQLHIQTEYPIQITVIKDSVVNAFALPGGGIVVYDAILNKMQTPDELAALLAHEYSHIELKHATRGMFRNIAGYAFLSIVFSDVTGIAALIIQNGNELINLSYTRELEQEADANGLIILKQNKLNADGMIALFEQLKKQEKAKVNELISTHPDLDARIQAVQEFKTSNTYSAITNDSLTHYFNKLKINETW